MNIKKVNNLSFIRNSIFLYSDIIYPISFFNCSIQIKILSISVSFHVSQTSHIFLSIFVHKLAMSGLVLIKRALKITAFLESVMSFSMLLKVSQASRVIISIRVLNYYVADYVQMMPISFHNISLLWKIMGYIVTETILFPVDPASFPNVSNNLSYLANAMLFTIFPLAQIYLTVVIDSLAIACHFFLFLKLSLIDQFCAVKKSNQLSTIVPGAPKILVFIPVVKAFAMKQVLIKISEIILTVGKDLETQVMTLTLQK